jgi:hypothetical protein
MPQSKIGIPLAKTQRREGKNESELGGLGALARANPHFEKLPADEKFARITKTFKHYGVK